MTRCRNKWEYKSFGALFAVEEGNALDLARAIERGCEVHNVCQDKSYANPLMLAAGKGRTDLVEMLLDAGADPNGFSATGGGSALAHALRSDSAPCAKLLLDAGANLPPVRHAMFSIMNGANVFMLLIERGAFSLEEAYAALNGVNFDGARRALAMVEAAIIKNKVTPARALVRIDI